MSNRTFRANVRQASATTGNWATRSTGPGVVWAHNFENAAEVQNFLYTSNGYYQYQKTDPMAAIRGDASELGSGAGCIKARTYSARIPGGLLSVPKGTVEVIQLDNATPFMRPQDYYNGWYWLLIGHATNEEQYRGYPQEVVRVDAVDHQNHTLTVRRGHVTYSGQTHAPAHTNNTPIGITSMLRWNRPMCAIRAGSNGRTADDIGIQNGFRPVDWTWTRTAHGRFHRGYWGSTEAHAAYDALWPPADNYDDPAGSLAAWGNAARGLNLGWAKYTTIFPQQQTVPAQIQNVFAHSDPEMCNEYWLQWRQYLPASKVDDTSSKLLYLQTADISTPQQLFINISNLARPNVPSAAGGTGPELTLAHNFSETIPDFVNNSAGWSTMDDLIVYNHWLDSWATIMLHVKLGRGIREWPEYPAAVRVPRPRFVARFQSPGV
jgi:hypothetical protein